MLTKLIATLTLLIAAAHAEAPLNRAAPYAPAGWRPNIPFNLPGDFAEQQQPQQAVNIELSKERVNFAGQIAGNSLLPQNAPQNSYLPPDEDVIITQALPNPSQVPNFNAPQQPPRPIFQRPQGERPVLQPRPQPHFQPQRPHARPPVQHRPGHPPHGIFPNQQKPGNFNPSTAPPQPADSYGPPTGRPTQDANGSGFTIIYPDLEPRSFDQPDIEFDGNANDDDVADLPLSSAPSQPQPQVAAAPSNNLNEGRYYILTPENTLQRVSYRTVQDSADARANGFTAQLKYATVGEVRDPIYKYNNEGQLVRLLK